MSMFDQVGKKIVLVAICGFTGFTFPFGAIALEVPALQKAPFWQRKPKVMKKILEGRDVFVAVKSWELPKPLVSSKRLEMTGVGVVRAPLDFCFRQAQSFQILRELSGYIKEIKYFPVQKRLYMHSYAFGYHAKMWFEVEFVGRVPGKKGRRELLWTIVEGVFQGMKGALIFEAEGRRKSLMSLMATYDYNRLAIPSFFVKFGLEVVLRQMAQKMRVLVEKKYDLS